MREPSGIRVARKTIGIAAAVPALVAVAHELCNHRERRCGREDSLADLGVGSDEGQFVLVERAGLREDGVRDRNLADVVELRRLPNRCELILRHAELTRDGLRGVRNVTDVGGEPGVTFGEGAQQDVRALPARRHPPSVLEVVHALVGQQQCLVRCRNLGQRDRAVRASNRKCIAVLAQRFNRGSVPRRRSAPIRGCRTHRRPGDMPRLSRRPHRRAAVRGAPATHRPPDGRTCRCRS